MLLLPKSLNIAIIGSGFAGLSLAWCLHKKRGCRITLFDKRGFTGGASRVAAGLVHPYSSKTITLAPYGEQAYSEAVSLFAEASAFQEDDFIIHRGMVRLTSDDKALLCSYHDDCPPQPGIFLEKALTIDTNLYLNALIKGLYGVTFVQESVSSLDDLKDFDAIVLCSGYETLGFKEAQNLPFNYLKGQGLEFVLPKNMKSLTHAISSKIYLTMMKNGNLFAGATFERGLSDPEPDEKCAKEKIIPELIELFPQFNGIEPVSIRSGVRLTTKGYFPLTEKIGEKLWVFSGLGSKGLLYHALLGKQLASSITSI